MHCHPTGSDSPRTEGFTPPAFTPPTYSQEFSFPESEALVVGSTTTTTTTTSTEQNRDTATATIATTTTTTGPVSNSGSAEGNAPPKQVPSEPRVVEEEGETVVSGSSPSGGTAEESSCCDASVVNTSGHSPTAVTSPPKDLQVPVCTVHVQ